MSIKLTQATKKILGAKTVNRNVSVSNLQRGQISFKETCWDNTLDIELTGSTTNYDYSLMDDRLKITIQWIGNVWISIDGHRLPLVVNSRFTDTETIDNWFGGNYTPNANKPTKQQTDALNGLFSMAHHQLKNISKDEWNNTRNQINRSVDKFGHI